MTTVFSAQTFFTSTELVLPNAFRIMFKTCALSKTELESTDSSKLFDSKRFA